jgi:ATP-binding cassette subfamily F protein 3
VILISHDRHLVEATADRLWIVKGGTVSVYDGDMESYRAELLSERGSGSRRGSQGSEGAEGRSDRNAQRRASAQKRQQLAPLKKAMQDAEKQVEKLAAEVAQLDAALGDPALYGDPQKAQRITFERGLASKKLVEAEEDWLRATAAFEEAEQSQHSAVL